MFFFIKSCAFSSLGPELVSVESDVARGMPVLNIVGLPDIAVKEAKERIRAAIINSELPFPKHKRITINLSPAGNKKEGTQLELAMAVSLLAAAEEIPRNHIEEIAVLGELSLDGRINPITRALPLSIEIRKKGIFNILLPKENIKDVEFLEGMRFFPVETLTEAFEFLTRRRFIEPVVGIAEFSEASKEIYNMDFSEVKGREEAKRAVEICVSGFHNLLMTGAPGCGKSLIAKRIETVLPEMEYEEKLEVTRIYSLWGKNSNGAGLIHRRPFRAPAGNTTVAAMIGGGSGMPRPGEISLSHFGTLFLDEMPEFRRDVLEALRQPIEDEKVTISRSGGSVTYPCKFMLVGARNPCMCGYRNDTEHICTCTPMQIKKYKERISGPIMDRFDLFLDMAREDYGENLFKNAADGNTQKSSAQMREQINLAIEVQKRRYESEHISYNSQLRGDLIKKYCVLEHDAVDLFSTAYKMLKLSPRAGDKLLKVSRTIADMEEEEIIRARHMSEAIQFRSRDDDGYKQ